MKYVPCQVAKNNVEDQESRNRGKYSAAHYLENKNVREKDSRLRKVQMQAELHIAQFLKKNWTRTFPFQKILKTILGVDNIAIYHCENFQSQIRYILIWWKKTNMKIWMGEPQNFEI